MKNLSWILGTIFLGSLVTGSTPDIKIIDEVKKDKLIEADYRLTKNKFNVTFGVSKDTIKNKNR